MSNSIDDSFFSHENIQNNDYYSKTNCELRKLTQELNSLKLKVRKIEKIEQDIRTLYECINTIKDQLVNINQKIDQKNNIKHY